MSLNKAINAVIAVIEERPEVAKGILREPTSDVKSIPEVLNRLRTALNKYAAGEIRQGLLEALHVEPDRDAESHPDTFYSGVRAVETVFEQRIFDLES